MLSNSLRTRGVVFAFLFGRPRMVERGEASQIHNKVCDALGLDDLTFRFSTSEPEVRASSRGFSIRMERQEGHGAFQVVLDHTGSDNPIRLMMEFHWPPSLEHVIERFDITTDAVFSAMPGTWQRVLAEARIRAQCDVQKKNALRYLTENMLNLPPGHADVLGSPVSFAKVGLHVSPTQQTEDSLGLAHHELSVEVLREDPAALYLELMSRWSQVPLGASTIELTSIRPIDRKPSEYVEAAYGTLVDWVRVFGSRNGGH